MPIFKRRDDGLYMRFQPNDFHFDLRRLLTRHLSPESQNAFNLEADNILKIGKTVDDAKLKSFTGRAPEEYRDLAKELNARTSELLHKFNIDVLEYPNHNFMEGQNKSYIITDPSVIKSWVLEEKQGGIIKAQPGAIQVLDKMTDKDITKATNSGLITANKIIK